MSSALPAITIGLRARLERRVGSGTCSGCERGARAARRDRPRVDTDAPSSGVDLQRRIGIAGAGHGARPASAAAAAEPAAARTAAAARQAAADRAVARGGCGGARQAAGGGRAAEPRRAGRAAPRCGVALRLRWRRRRGWARTLAGRQRPRCGRRRRPRCGWARRWTAGAARAAAAAGRAGDGRRCGGAPLRRPAAAAGRNRLARWCAAAAERCGWRGCGCGGAGAAAAPAAAVPAVAAGRWIGRAHRLAPAFMRARSPCRQCDRTRHARRAMRMVADFHARCP